MSKPIEFYCGDDIRIDVTDLRWQDTGALIDLTNAKMKATCARAYPDGRVAWTKKTANNGGAITQITNGDATGNVTIRATRAESRAMTPGLHDVDLVALLADATTEETLWSGQVMMKARVTRGAADA